jgi:membrane protein implicated in regulation of membrane protease activity
MQKEIDERDAVVEERLRKHREKYEDGDANVIMSKGKIYKKLEGNGRYYVLYDGKVWKCFERDYDLARLIGKYGCITERK